MAHLDGLLSGLDVRLSDGLLDRIDEIVPPGTNVGTLDQDYQPPPSSTRTCAPCTSAQQPDGHASGSLPSRALSLIHI